MHLFHYNAAARIPAHVQLEEQVKVALALGKLRPGDLLPSIRNVEDELGVGRMLVRKAYQQLASSMAKGRSSPARPAPTAASPRRPRR